MTPEEREAYEEMLSKTPLRELGEAHLRIIQSARKMGAAVREETQDERGFVSFHSTDFGKLVAEDEIAWWVRKRVDSLDVLNARAVEVREALQKLLKDAKALQSKDAPTRYLGLVESIFRICTSNAKAISTFLEFVKWLEELDDLGPSILFTYKVWGSTRLGEREFHDAPALDEQEQLRICTEWATGFRIGPRTTLNKVTLDVSGEMADSIDPEAYSGPIDITYERIHHRVASAVTGNLVTYFEFLRNSCRDLEIEIIKAEEIVAVFDSEAFWQAFVDAVVKTNRTEESCWDLKQSLEMWHAKGDDKCLKEQDFDERVAAFANTEGGVLVIGVTDAPPRKILGVQDIENRIKHIYSSIFSHLDLTAPALKVKEVLLVDDAGVSRPCLVVGVAKSPTVVCVKDKVGKLSYPIRNGPGIVLSNPSTIGLSKRHQKGYDWGFLDHIRAIARSS